MDVAQIIRKLYTFNLVNKLEIKIFDKTAIYGVFSHLIGKCLDKVFDSPGGAEAGLKALLVNSRINNLIPFCIVYTHTDEKGEKKVIVRRFLYAGVYSKNISNMVAKSGSGGKDIGTVK
jgi:hypothetical protein